MLPVHTLYNYTTLTNSSETFLQDVPFKLQKLNVSGGTSIPYSIYSYWYTIKLQS